MSHSNHHWKVATHYLMFAALGSVHDKEQNKLIKITVHCTVTVLSLSVMPTCHALHSLPPLFSMPSFLTTAYVLFPSPQHSFLGKLGAPRGQGHVGVSPAEDHQGGLAAGAPGECKSWACLA